jgi:hypothetical protein
MAQLQSKTAYPASPLLLALGSVAILFHFSAVIVHALAAPSGPWPTMDGMNLADPPSFTQSLDESLVQSYLKPLKLTHNYHFLGNRPIAPGVYLEVKLKDAKGEPLMTVRFPDPNANAWVRYMQELFAQGLVPDQPLPPLQGEAVPAPNQQVRIVPIWDHVPNGESLQMRRMPEHLIPRNRPVYSPTEWSLVLVNSYARYLCRKHVAASAEVIRHSREAIAPSALVTGNPPPMAFTDLIASYGDLSGE